MTALPAWGPADLHGLFRDGDLRFGNVEEWGLSQLGTLLERERPRTVTLGSALVGAALRDGDELLLTVGADPGIDRLGIARELLSEVGAPAACWVPTGDTDLAMALQAHGWRHRYVDLQLRRALSGTSTCVLPKGFHLTDLPPDSPSALHRAVHELACEAWEVAPHLEEFLDRYVRRAAYDPGLWVLAEDGSGVCGAVVGHVEELPDARVGKVASLAVVQRARRRGLAAALLEQLCGRFQDRGLRVAQLGVHEENRSGAPAMYRHLGWRTVSRRTLWKLPAETG